MDVPGLLIRNMRRKKRGGLLGKGLKEWCGGSVFVPIFRQSTRIIYSYTPL